MHNIEMDLADDHKNKVMWLLACAYHELGNMEGASESIRLLMKRVPTSPRVWNKCVKLKSSLFHHFSFGLFSFVFFFSLHPYTVPPCAPLAVIVSSHWLSSA
jgi:hypothetical protein